MVKWMNKLDKNILDLLVPSELLALTQLSMYLSRKAVGVSRLSELCLETLPLPSAVIQLSHCKVMVCVVASSVDNLQPFVNFWSPRAL